MRPHDLRDQIACNVKYWTGRTELPAKRIVGWIGIRGGKFHDWKQRKGITNLYLCPLLIKVLVLGFTLFYLTECRNTATSIIFPFEEQYSQNTSNEIARIWKYTVELPSN